MAMDFQSFLTRVVQDGIASAKTDSQLQSHPKRLRGSISGFESCLGKNAAQLWELLADANRKAWDVRVEQEDDKDNTYDI